jgi:23S rRNA pseudouridine2605 synthase
MPDGERLQKVLARAGIASRRAAERLILDGRVAVNGTVVRTLGVRVGASDAVRVDGRPIRRAPTTHVSLMLNKPPGVVTTLADPEGRRTVGDLVEGAVRGRRLFPVGRLDYHSQGLLLVTDDGELARDLMDPRSGVPKTYAVKIRGRPSAEVLERLRRGIVLDGRRTEPARVRTLRQGDNPWIEIEITEGRKRQVRRMCERVGHPVLRLRRTGYAGLVLGDLPEGQWRRLTPTEVRMLRRAVSGGRPESA